jgi:enoyl-CoA hydratase/carnithine racemase
MAFVLYERKGHISTITLNRPEVRNAFTLAMLDELNECFIRFRSDENAWVAVVTGAGSAFSAGHDVNEINSLFKKGLGELPSLWDTFYHNSFQYDLELYKPVIAAVNGHCVGEGCLTAMSCDLRICSESALFSFPEVVIGIPTIIGGIKAARLMGLGHSMELILMGEQKDAKWAYRTGLVNKVVPDAELMDAAYAWAGRLAKLGPIAVRCAKEVILRSLDTNFFEAARLGEAMRRVSLQSNDAREGVTSFIEKRAPKFLGK